MKIKVQIFTWKKFHKYVGLVLTIFLLLFCISGIILNHRSFFAPYSVSRSILPEVYHIKNYNNGIIRGTIPYSDNQILAYGNAGIWLTDREFKSFSSFNNGLPAGADLKTIRNIVQTKDGRIWCAAQFGIYNLEGNKWAEANLPANDERITDLALTQDSCDIVALTRSAVYTHTNQGFKRVELQAPDNYSDKVSLFKTIWHLHSGDLFGTVGKIIVDIVAIVIIFLCISGIILFIMPYSIKKSLKSSLKSKTGLLKWNFKWHDIIGYYTVILTVLIAVTGMCLRPPLMIPFVMMKSAPIPGSTLDSKDVWHDKLRAIRWDDNARQWLVSTSDGFIYVNQDFANKPQVIDAVATPPVSPMGINVFESLGDNRWLIGSFSGLYIWNTVDGSILDYFSDSPHVVSTKGRPISNSLVTGFSKDLTGDDVIFYYTKGTDKPLPMPQILSDQPMSLWNFALELHVGRCYTPFLGPLSELFVFLSGLILTLILVSGLILHNRHKNKHNKPNHTNHTL